jgi:hypothetical protein
VTKEQVGLEVEQWLKEIKAKRAMDQSVRGLMEDLAQRFGFTAQDEQDLVDGVRAQMRAGTLDPLIAEEEVAFIRSLRVTE